MASLRKNSIYGFLGFALPSIITLIAYPILVNYFGDVLFGVYIVATSLSSSAALFEFGMSSATLKFVSEDWSLGNYQGVRETIATSIIFYLILGFSLGVPIWCMAGKIAFLFGGASVQQQAEWIFRITAVQLVITMLLSVIASSLKGMQMFDKTALLFSLQSILLNLGAILAVTIYDADIIAVAGIGLASSAFVCILGVFLLTRAEWGESQVHSIRISDASRRAFMKMLKFGGAVGVASIASVLHGQAQRMILGAVLGAQYVTSFHLGVWGPSKVNAATMALSEPFFPKVSSMGSSYKDARSLCGKYMVLNGLLAFMALSPLMFFSNEIYNFWFNGKPPLYSSKIATIMALALLVNSISQPVHHLMNGAGQPWVNTFFTLMSPITLYAILGVKYLFYKELDIFDFVWATAISVGVTSIANILWVNYKLEWLSFRR